MCDRQTKPFPWNNAAIKISPFKTKNRSVNEALVEAKRVLHVYNKTKNISFPYLSSLKSLGKIKRSHGKYELGDKYCKLFKAK